MIVLLTSFNSLQHSKFAWKAVHEAICLHSKPSKRKSLNSEKQRVDVERFCQTSKLLWFLQKSHFGRLHLWPHIFIFSHCLRSMTVGEGGDKHWLKHREFYLSQQLPFKTNERCKDRIRLIALALPEQTSNFCLVFHHSWMRPKETWTSPPASMILRQLAENIGQSFSKDGVRYLVLEVLIFVPAMPHATAKPFNACWRPDSEEAIKNNHLLEETD